MLLGPPLLGALLAVAVKPYRRFVGWANALLSLLSLWAAVALWRHILAGVVLTAGPQEFLRADALSTLLAFCVSVVGALAAWLGPGMSGDDGYDDAQARRFSIFGNLFTFMMLFAVVSNNVGFMWIAIEATTITSAMLIPLHVTKASVEASWKYILIGSIGIALAFGGTVLGYFDFVNLAGRHETALNWTVLMASAPRLHPPVIQLAFVFILIGYGTKAGLAPMHTWLPDAHSEAPSTLSAMMSGVLLAVAMYAIARWKAVVDVSIGPGFTNRRLIGFGLLSVAIGTFSLVIQRHYKRMLAYSSVEHMGLVSIGLGLGPLGVFAAWLHVVNHAVAKSTSFLLAGRILHRYHTTEINRVTGLFRAMPWTAALFAGSILALVGVPPFGLFVSEFLLVQAALAAQRPWLAAIVLLLLLTAFVSLLAHLNRMLYGDTPEGVVVGERREWSTHALVVPIVVLVVLGIVLPGSVSALIDQSVSNLKH